MAETFTTILGLYMIYTIGHLVFIQHATVWKDRTVYEKFVTCFAWFVILVLLVEIGK